MQHTIDVICLQETWCKTQSQYVMFAFDSYKYVTIWCTSTKHGGLIPYINRIMTTSLNTMEIIPKYRNHNLYKYIIKL